MSEFGDAPELSDMEFSYNQFFIYDASVADVGTEWTDAHVKQGFARRERTVAVATLLEFGTARVAILFQPLTEFERYERVLIVPLEVTSGAISIDGPEEAVEVDRRVSVPSGHYQITVAQRTIDDLPEEICVCLEKVDIPLQRSRLLIADDALDPPSPLVETADPITL